MSDKKPQSNKIISLTRVYVNYKWVYTMIIEVKGEPLTVHFEEGAGCQAFFNQIYPQVP